MISLTLIIENKNKKPSEFESNLTPVTLLTLFPERGEPFPLSGGVIAALSLPAAALRLAVLDALGAVSGAAAPEVGLRRALGVRGGLVVHVDLVVVKLLVVELLLVVVVVQLVVVVGHGRRLSCRVEFLGHRWATVVRRRVGGLV